MPELGACVGVVVVLPGCVVGVFGFGLGFGFDGVEPPSGSWYWQSPAPVQLAEAVAGSASANTTSSAARTRKGVTPDIPSRNTPVGELDCRDPWGPATEPSDGYS